MTATEIKVANALLQCTFLPGSFDKRFVKQLPNWQDREMTEKGRAMMLKLFQKYRRQIRNYEELLLEVYPDSFSIQFDMFGDAVITLEKIGSR